MYSLSFPEFQKLAKKGNLIPLYKEILADMDTPVTALRKIDNGDHTFLFESVEGGERWGRFSFLGTSPRIIITLRGNQISIKERGRKTIEKEVSDPLAEFKSLMRIYRPVEINDLPRFYGGAVGYFSYDMVRHFEALPVDTEDDLNVEDAYFMITDTMIIFDNIKKSMKVVCNVYVPSEKPSVRELKQIYQNALKKIDDIAHCLQKRVHVDEYDSEIHKNLKPLKLEATFSKAEHMKKVEKAKEYIRAGDIIQVVLSNRFSVKASVNPLSLYRALRFINPSPYMFFLRLKEKTLIGSSPEILVRVEADNITVRPIAGTRRRGHTQEEDLFFEKELLADPKERAEHVMLVDLGRNDVGRVTDTGTVKVKEFMKIERYSHVMHIVSDVQGKLRTGEDGYSALAATFPAGTLTGAPKIRAMEIIEELEKYRRGPYGGAVGYFAFNGNIDMCITIRSIFSQKGCHYIQAGGGIVADSDPVLEYKECQNKARGVIKALEMARGDLEICS